MAFVDPNPQAFRDPLTELTLIMLTITRQLAFDAGHRIPDHQSRCRNLHGHRYVLEITLQGSVIKTQGAPDCGMVMDFAEVKTLAMRHLVEAWDHAFLVYQDDARVRAFLETMPEHKTVIINRIPTAENLAAIAFERLAGVYDAHYGVNLRLAKVRLYETPHCWADVVRDGSTAEAGWGSVWVHSTTPHVRSSRSGFASGGANWALVRSASAIPTYHTRKQASPNGFRQATTARWIIWSNTAPSAPGRLNWCRARSAGSACGCLICPLRLCEGNRTTGAPANTRSSLSRIGRWYRCMRVDAISIRWCVSVCRSWPNASKLRSGHSVIAYLPIRRRCSKLNSGGKPASDGAASIHSCCSAMRDRSSSSENSMSIYRC